MILTCQACYRFHGCSSCRIAVKPGGDVPGGDVLSTLTSPMTWTLDFQGKILKLLYLRDGQVNSLGMKGM